MQGGLTTKQFRPIIPNKNMTNNEIKVGQGEGPQSEERKPRKIGGVIEIASSPDGWSRDRVRFTLNTNKFISGSLDASIQPGLEGLKNSYEITQQERGPKGDHNGLKVWPYQIQASRHAIEVYAGLTDYFTLWGMKKADPALHQGGLKELTTKHKTDIPFGISTHNLLLIGQGASEKLVMVVQSKGHAFSAGKASTSFEEQMEPDQEHPAKTAHLGYFRELGLNVDPTQIKLLGIGAEEGTAYTSWCHISRNPNLTEGKVLASWNTAIENKEGIAVLFVPVEELSLWQNGIISYNLWGKYDHKGTIQRGIDLSLHATSPWRLKLLEEHLQRKAEDDRKEQEHWLQLEADRGLSSKS